VPRAGLNPDALVGLALSVVDDEGLAGLTLTKVAERAGVAVPALYKHVRNLAELQQLVTLRVIDELTGELTTASIGRSGDDAFAALATAYRRYAVRHPHRYVLLAKAPEPGTPAAEAADRMLSIFLAVLRGYGLSGSDAIHAARIGRAAIHGFASIEVANGFGLAENADTTYALMIRLLAKALPDLAGSS
jgi:AcrR family transcriptional regulator